MTTSIQTNSIDLQLQSGPSTTDDVLCAELPPLYNAISILQIELSRVGRFAVKCNAVITAGDFVAMTNNAGECKAVRATAISPGDKQAVGFALQSGTVGSWIVVCTTGSNNYVAALTPGLPYYLSDSVAGGVTATKPVGAGKIVQAVGFALNATTLVLNVAAGFTQL